MFIGRSLLSVLILAGRKAIVTTIFPVVAIVCMIGEVCAADAIKIAMITAKTGKAGRSNAVSFEGARFAVDTINESGGILGRKVVLLEYDNLSTPEGSAAAGRQAVKDGAVAVVGCNWSSHSKAMAEVLQAAKTPMISHMSTNESVTRVGDFIFRICFTDSFQGYGLARFAIESLSSHSAVVLVDRTRTYSIGLADAFFKAFVDGGGVIAWRGEYSSRDFDAEAMLRAVAEHDPDILFVPGGYADVAAFFGQAKAMGVKGDLMSGDGIGIKLFDYIGNKANGIYSSAHWSRWIDTPQSRDFVKRFEKAIKPITEDTNVLAYDCFMVLQEAIERAGSVDKQRVRDSLASIEGFNGVTGTIRFDENGDPIKPMVINQFKFGGMMFLERVTPLMPSDSPAP